MLFFLIDYTVFYKCILYNPIYSPRVLNKVTSFKFCSIYTSMRFANQCLLKISPIMYHTDAHHRTFQALFYIFQKHISISDMCFCMRHENLTYPKMFLSKLSRKWFSDLGQAMPFMDLPKKTVSIISTKKYFLNFWSIVFICLY